MDPVTVYAIGLCGVFGILFLISTVLPLVLACLRPLFLLSRRFLAHVFVINRHSLAGPWTVGLVVAHLAWLACNVATVWLGADSAAQASSRMGSLALLNMAPLYLAAHLSVIADVLGLNLRTLRLLHRFFGCLAAAHVLAHGVLETVRRNSDGKGLVPELYESTGAGLLLLLLVLLVPYLRRWAYEIFLRLHQALAVGVCFCAVKHVVAGEGFSLLPLYIFAGVVCSLTVIQAATVAYRNKQFGAAGSRIDIRINHGSISGTIELSRPLQTDAGQYINIWMPSVSAVSSHPFVVTSWSPLPQREIKIFVQRRNGFTRRLASRASRRLLTPRVFFSGPHGRSLPLWDVGRVVLFASGFGIVAMLPILRKLMYGRRKGKSRAAVTHLVWRVNDLDLRRAVNSELNEMLESNPALGSDVLYISVYNGIDMQVESSQHRHFIIYPGEPDVSAIMKCELARTMVEPVVRKPPATSKLPTIREDVEDAAGEAQDAETGSELARLTDEEDADRGMRTLVLVSAGGQLRDEVRRAVGASLFRGVELRELDWQPD